jgi:dimethylglycine dehydrogenase
MVLTPMLSPSARLMGDLTLACLDAERFMIFGSGVAEAFHMRWFESRCPERGVTVRPLMAHLGGFAIAGPRARELLARVTHEDVSAEAFRFFAVRRMAVAMAPALVARVSFTGELGYEIYVEAGYQVAVYDALLRAGRDLGLRHFGGRALHALRLEKSFGAWLREYTPDYTPFQSGLGRFIDWQKDFVGREAAQKLRDQPCSHVLATLVVEALDADAVGDEPVLSGDRVVGFVTSGGYGHTVGASIALAYLEPELASPDADLAVEILGERRTARLAPEPLVDPTGARMRS